MTEKQIKLLADKVVRAVGFRQKLVTSKELRNIVVKVLSEHVRDGAE